jgi:hypothetical protein
MTTGTLIRPSKIGVIRTSDVTAGCNEEELESREEGKRNEFLRRRDTLELVNTEPYYYSDANDLDLENTGAETGRMAASLGQAKETLHKQASNIWDSDKLVKLLDEPIGSPVSLTIDEAREIISLAAGRRPDLPSGKELVRGVREVLGHSIAERVKKAI